MQTRNPVHLAALRGTAVLLVLVLSFLLLTPRGTPRARAVTAEQKSQLKQQIARLDQAIDGYENQIQQNSQQRGQAKRTAGSLQKQVSALQNQIAAYNGKISALNRKITLLDQEISGYQKQIDALEREMAPTKKVIAACQKQLGGRMRAVYMSGNVSTLELLMDSSSFTDFLYRMEMLDRISQHDNAVIHRLKKSISKQQARQDRLKKMQSSVASDRAAVSASRSQVVSAQATVKKRQSELDVQIKLLAAYVDALDLNSEEAKQSIELARQEQQTFTDQLNGRLAITSSTGTGTVDIRLNPGGMIWPVPDSASYISSGYGPRGGTVHYGIDIADPNSHTRNVAIVAAAAGTVKVSSNICSHNYGKHYNCGCNGGYGNYVVIDHGNGLLSYYGHMSHTVVAQGQTVRQGQIIGYMGATGYATGPHLHFEIRVNNGQRRSLAARNPLTYVRK
ncbi:MAG: peptidoglycan DD-metalloendopeptidase family protein [Oscillospiraceae bacterium]|nr:peptidoglycan DD-metalloendopeptidase family protein [Oscillospiraceae bacterium]